MANISPPVVSVRRASMVLSVSTKMNVPAMQIAAFRENVLTYREQHCHANSVSVTSAGLVPAATRGHLTRQQTWICQPIR